MKRKFDSIKTFAVAAVLGMTALIPAQAEDTEIYTGLNSAANGIDPNVMFIIDTSGSMGSSVTSVIAAYAPTTNYTGTCGTNGRIYFSTSGNTPSCNSSSYFNDSKFRCAAANNPLFGTNATGFYQDRVARLASGGFFSSRSRWRSLSRFDHNPTHVDCKADENIHGGDDYDAADGGGGNYIRNNTSGYTTNASNKKNWNSTGSFTTIYSANYMRYYHGSSSVVTTDRISIVKDVVKSMIDANTNLNISLMRFDTNSSGTGRNRGGPIIFPFSDIDATGVRTNFKSSIDGLSASGNTPLAETMREAARVYRGETAVSGLSPNNIQSVSTSFLNGSTTYDTPLDVQCQKNFIIYLTDGEPTADFEFDSNIKTLISGSDLPSNDTSCGGNDNCLDELAEYLNEVDQISTLNGKQNVVTYTIGFFSNQTLLSNAATKGGGQYYLADNFAALSDAFSQIITEIQAVNTTFTAPAVSVNAFNRVTNRKELFFTLFKPNSSPIWTGNLKRYELDFLLDGSGDPVDSDGDGEEDPPQVLDQNGTVAVDPQTGFFDISSTSYWTQSADSPDGDETSLGGAARLFGATPGNLTAEDPANRTVYTYTGVKTDLSEPENLVRPNTTICGSCGTNALLTTVFMDSTSTTTTATSPSLQDLIDWRAGVDIRDDNANGDNTEARQAMADPLHTKPLLVTYGSTDANPDITLFMATNDGSLHAMDVDDGTEVFTFIPPEQMAKSRTAFDNTVTGSKTYGLDGSLTVFHR
ncbi:MAG: hypothetical protein HOI35_11755, partial [Woeseia sp.]|nr:hypothetical protein [Woeseia sp.]